MKEIEKYLAITPQASEAEVLRLLISLGIQVAGASEGAVLIYDRETAELVFAMSSVDDPALLGQRVPIDQGITGLAAATREVQMGAPTYRIDQTAEYTNEPSAVLAAPMLVADELVGVLTAVSFSAGVRFTPTHGELYGRLATIAAIVIHQRQLLRADDGIADRRIAELVTSITRRPGGHAGLLEVLSGIERMTGQ